MTLIEVMVAVAILTGVLIGLSNFTRRFQHLTINQSALATASELAAARLEILAQWRPYSTLATTGVASTEPSMAGYTDYTRTTSAVRTTSSTADYVTITVTVSNTKAATTVSKSLVIAAF